MTRDEQLIKAALEMAAGMVEKSAKDAMEAADTSDMGSIVATWLNDEAEAIRDINPADVLANVSPAEIPSLVQFGYAPGSYYCYCGECGRIHTADKRAFRCLTCAEVLAKVGPDSAPDPALFQDRVAPWMQECFGAEISADKLERSDRLLEEVLELLQSGNYPPERIATLTKYVWSRDLGEPAQEVGGVMVTLAAYCLAHGLNMHTAGETELERIWTKVEKIRAKQAAKPKGSALPLEWAEPAPDALARLVEAANQARMAFAGYVTVQSAIDRLDEALAAMEASHD